MEVSGQKRTYACGGLLPGVKRPGCGADHSHLYNAEVKDAWSYNSTPTHIFMALCLSLARDTPSQRGDYFKHRDIFTIHTYIHTYIHTNIHKRLYPKVSGLAACSENYKWYSCRCSCIVILWIILVSFGAITLWRGQQRVIPKVSGYFVIDSVRKLLDTTSYIHTNTLTHILWIRKFVMATIGCGINHEDTKRTDTDKDTDTCKCRTEHC
jgi:hypothetical protein